MYDLNETLYKESLTNQLLPSGELLRDINHNRSLYEQSGIVDYGKHGENGSTFNPVNEGMWARSDQTNILCLGRAISAVAGASTSNFPTINIGGLLVELLGHTSGHPGYYDAFRFDTAPDGSSTFDEESGTIVNYLSDVDVKYGNAAGSSQEAVSRAFEGIVSNGDFRYGTLDWNTGVVSVTNGVATISGTNSNCRNSNYTLESGVEYVVGVNCTSYTSGVLEFTNNNRVHVPLIVDSVGYHEFTFTASDTDPAYFFWIHGGALLDVDYMTLRKASGSVLTDRVDIGGIEGFFEKITKDNPFIYPNGIIHDKSPTIHTYTTVVSNRPDSYYGQFKGDTNSRGLGVDFLALSIVERNALMRDKSLRLYVLPDGDVVQFRVRFRTFKGVGNGDWQNVFNSGTSTGALCFKSLTNTYAIAQGKLDTTDYEIGAITATARPYYALNHTNRLDTVDRAIWQTDGTLVSDIEGGCYFLPLFSVSRLNQGAHSEILNDSGALMMATTGGGNLWCSDGVLKSPVTARDCFIDHANGGSRINGGYGGNLAQSSSGRVDGRYHDVIYSSGLGGVVDRRLPAKSDRSMEGAEIVRQRLRDGTYRGLEPMTKTGFFEVIDVHTWVGESQATNHRVVLRFTSGTHKPLSTSYPEYTIKDTSNADSQGWRIHNPTIGALLADWSNAGRTDGVDLFLDKYASSTHWSGLNVGDKVWLSRNNNEMLQESMSSTSVSGNYVHTDLIADIADIYNSPFLGGWVGGHINEKPLGDYSTQTFELTRKAVKSLPLNTLRITLDHGATWEKYQQVPTEDEYNDIFLNIKNSPDVITMVSYWAFAKQTVAGYNGLAYNTVLGQGEIFTTDNNRIERGCLLNESLFGTILTSGATGKHTNTLTVLDSALLSGTLISNNNSYRPKHSPVELDAPSGKPLAFKCMMQQRLEGEYLYLQVMGNELIYSAGNWGDDGYLNVGYPEVVNSDLNGSLSKTANHILALPYSWT
jgi:hypothetical protein